MSNLLKNHPRFKGIWSAVHKTRIYRSFTCARNRCNYKLDKSFHLYGGRGIKFTWTSFIDFINDMGDSFLDFSKEHGEKNTTLDRIDNNGDYSKENCRWATLETQAGNRRDSIRLTYDGKTMSLAQWSRLLNIPITTLNRRYHKKWPIHIILSKKNFNFKENYE
jgi:hypothetical protein